MERECGGLGGDVLVGGGWRDAGGGGSRGEGVAEAEGAGDIWGEVGEGGGFCDGKVGWGGEGYMGGEEGFRDHLEEIGFGERLRRPLTNLTICGGNGNRGFREDAQDLDLHCQQRQMAPS